MCVTFNELYVTFDETIVTFYVMHVTLEASYVCEVHLTFEKCMLPLMHIIFDEIYVTFVRCILPLICCMLPLL